MKIKMFCLEKPFLHWGDMSFLFNGDKIKAFSFKGKKIRTFPFEGDKNQNIPIQWEIKIKMFHLEESFLC